MMSDIENVVNMLLQRNKTIMPDLNKTINKLLLEIQIADYACVDRTRVSLKLLKDACILLEKKNRIGKWIEYPDCLEYYGAYSDTHIVCSFCKHVFSTMDNCTEEFNFCPWCGADMRDSYDLSDKEG